MISKRGWPFLWGRLSGFGAEGARSQQPSLHRSKISKDLCIRFELGRDEARPYQTIW